MFFPKQVSFEGKSTRGRLRYTLLLGPALGVSNFLGECLFVHYTVPNGRIRNSFTKHFRYLKWRYENLYKQYGYGLCEGKPAPKIALVQVQETLHFRYLKFLVIDPWIQKSIRFTSRGSAYLSHTMVYLHLPLKNNNNCHVGKSW